MYIIVVDNASSDLTETFITYLQDVDEPVYYVKMAQNENFLKAVNEGWKYVKTPYVMLLNNDAYVDNYCIEEMMKGITLKDVGIVGAMEYFPDGRPTKDRPYIYFGKEKLLDTELLDFKPRTDFVDVDIVGSACCLIKKEVWEKIGYFDELFAPCMCEQEDYFLRAKIAGFKIVMATNANFIHIVGGTTTFNNVYYQKVIEENKKKFEEKWKNYRK
jgi:GT2 family glycosyltransferase